MENSFCAEFVLSSLALKSKPTLSQMANFLSLIRIPLRLASCLEPSYDSTQSSYPHIAGLDAPTCWDTNNACNTSPVFPFPISAPTSLCHLSYGL